MAGEYRLTKAEIEAKIARLEKRIKNANDQDSEDMQADIAELQGVLKSGKYKGGKKCEGMNNIQKSLAILEGTTLIESELLFEEMITEMADLNAWNDFFKKLVKLSTKVNDKFATVKDYLKSVWDDVVDQLGPEKLKQLLSSPTAAFTNGAIKQAMVAAANSAGAALSVPALRQAIEAR